MTPLRGVLVSFAFAASGVSASPGGQTSHIDLARPFGARSAWRFTAVQGADIPDPIGADGDSVAGPIRLCVSNDGARTCNPDLGHLLLLPGGADDFSEPHFLNDARIVQAAQHKLLLVQVASLRGGNGDQRVATIVLAYDRGKDSFVPVYRQRTGRNNNQEIRFVATGPLQGAMISAEPTQDAPFAFWIIVSGLSALGYDQVLRYRSATRYGDGNPLAVIDSEMPNIQRRLGMRRPGLPLPQGRCAKPHLVNGALWC